MKHVYTFLIAAGASVLSTTALAHDHSAASGFVAGLTHPLTGVDHLIALVLAGLFIGHRASARWIAVSGLVLAMGAGTAGALLLGAQAWMEAAILLSLPVFVALQWMPARASVKLALLTMSLFMVAHGWVHGLEPAALNNAFVFGVLMMSAAVISLSCRTTAAVTRRAGTLNHARQ